ncbi:unnamed protein product, partial [Chrysoparadoxa australica]
MKFLSLSLAVLFSIFSSSLSFFQPHVQSFGLSSHAALADLRSACKSETEAETATLGRAEEKQHGLGIVFLTKPAGKDPEPESAAMKALDELHAELPHVSNLLLVVCHGSASVGYDSGTAISSSAGSGGLAKAELCMLPLPEEAVTPCLLNPEGCCQDPFSGHMICARHADEGAGVPPSQLCLAFASGNDSMPMVSRLHRSFITAHAEGRAPGVPCMAGAVVDEVFLSTPARHKCSIKADAVGMLLSSWTTEGIDRKLEFSIENSGAHTPLPSSLFSVHEVGNDGELQSVIPIEQGGRCRLSWSGVSGPCIAQPDPVPAGKFLRSVLHSQSLLHRYSTQGGLGIGLFPSCGLAAGCFALQEASSTSVRTQGQLQRGDICDVRGMGVLAGLQCEEMLFDSLQQRKEGRARLGRDYESEGSVCLLMRGIGGRDPEAGSEWAEADAQRAFSCCDDQHPVVSMSSGEAFV